MKVLVAGASGATGRHLVDQLLIQKHKVKAIVRSPEKLPESWSNNANLQIVSASISELSIGELSAYSRDCQAIVSCLGHNLTWKGVYGHPRKLVTEATRNLCQAIKANEPKQPVRFILMNTTGNRNRDLYEPISFAQKCVLVSFA